MAELAGAAVAATSVRAVFDERIAVVAADVGAERFEALVMTVAVDETLRIAIGRVRPRSSPGNAFVFHPGGGFTDFDQRSFPSLHSAVAFATAAALN
jgi:hypothetical protein